MRRQLMIGLAWAIAATPAPLLAQTVISCTENPSGTSTEIALEKPKLAAGVKQVTTGKRAMKTPPHLEFSSDTVAGRTAYYFLLGTDFHDAMQVGDTTVKLVNLDVEYVHKGKVLLSAKANALRFNYKDPMLMQSQALVLAIYQDGPSGSFTIRLRSPRLNNRTVLAEFPVSNALVLNAIGKPVRCPANITIR